MPTYVRPGKGSSRRRPSTCIILAVLFCTCTLKLQGTRAFQKFFSLGEMMLASDMVSDGDFASSSQLLVNFGAVDVRKTRFCTEFSFRVEIQGITPGICGSMVIFDYFWHKRTSPGPPHPLPEPIYLNYHFLMVVFLHEVVQNGSLETLNR